MSSYTETKRANYEAPTEIFPARILEVRPYNDRAALILDSTNFYPEGGGQPGDRGSVNGIPLLDVREQNGEILHIISADDAKKAAPGPAELAVDWARRREYTSLHTAQHLLSGTILARIKAHTVSMHLGDEECTIDVDTPAISDGGLIEIEEAVASAIEENHPVIIHLCPPERVEDFPLRKIPPQGEEVIRVVEIKGNDFSPCCGTHLVSTGEIGMLRILSAEKYKGMTRVRFIAGRRVLRDSRMLRGNGDVVSRALKVPVNETGAAVLVLLEKTNQLERKLKAFEEEAAARQAEELLKKAGLLDGGPEGNAGKVFVESFDGMDMETALRIGRAAQKLTAAVLVLASVKDIKFAGLCSRKQTDIRPLFKEALEKRGGKGGGGPSFFQGQFEQVDVLADFIKSLPREITV
jgi:alanyl-tRNA synthetase